MRKNRKLNGISLGDMRHEVCAFCSYLECTLEACYGDLCKCMISYSQKLLFKAISLWRKW